MNQQTQQFMYRVVISTVCGILAAVFVFLFVAAVHFGDGEGIKIIGAMQPLAITTLTALVTTVLGAHAAGAYIAKQQASVSIAAGSPSMAPMSAQVPSPLAIPVAAVPTTTTTTTTVAPVAEPGPVAPGSGV